MRSLMLFFVVICPPIGSMVAPVAATENQDLIFADGFESGDASAWLEPVIFSDTFESGGTGFWEGPRAHWRFDEGSGEIAHDSISSSDAAINGAEWAAGVTGTALYFDGSQDSANVSVTTALDLGTGFEIRFWFKTDDSVARPPPPILEFRKDDTPQLEVYFLPGTGELGVHITPCNNLRVECGNGLNDGEWHPVLIRWRNYRWLEVIHDVGSCSSAIGYDCTTAFSGWETITIGHRQPPAGYNSFNGHIDELRIHTIAQ